MRLRKYNKKENKIPLPTGCHVVLGGSQKNTAIRRLDLLSGASWVPLCYGLIPAQIKLGLAVNMSCRLHVLDMNNLQVCQRFPVLILVQTCMSFFLLWKQKKVVS